jgi:hypothetical protein
MIARMKFLRKFSKVIYGPMPWFVFAAIILVSAWRIASFINVADAAPDQSTLPKTGGQPSPQLTPEQVQILTKQALDAQSADKLKEEVKGYLEWLIAIAGVFSVVGTIAAGFTAQAFTDQAEKSVGQADKKFQALMQSSRGKLKKFKKKYGELVVAEDTRKKALDSLKEHKDSVVGSDGGFEWRGGKFYALMESSKRQRLLSSERYLGYDLKLNIDDKVNTPLFLRLLANFYVAKFEYENGFNSGNIGDLERAEYLLKLWTRPYPDQFEMRNDLGLIYTRFYAFFRALEAAASVAATQQKAKAEATKYLDSARTEFTESRRTQPRQQRAQYNLAFISGEEGNLQQAIDFLKEGSGNTNWEQKPNEENAGQLNYNLACNMALKIVEDNAAADTARVEELINFMKSLEGKAHTPKEQVDEDFDNDGVAKKPKGDFYDLIQELGKLGQASTDALTALQAARAKLSP